MTKEYIGLSKIKTDADVLAYLDQATGQDLTIEDWKAREARALESKAINNGVKKARIVKHASMLHTVKIENSVLRHHD